MHACTQTHHRKKTEATNRAINKRRCLEQALVETTLTQARVLRQAPLTWVKSGEGALSKHSTAVLLSSTRGAISQALVVRCLAQASRGAIVTHTVLLQALSRAFVKRWKLFLRFTCSHVQRPAQMLGHSVAKGEVEVA